MFSHEMARRNEIIDRDLAQYAADWASDLDDEAGKLARRLEVETDAAYRLDMVRLIATLREAGALLKGMPGAEPAIANDDEAIGDEVLRACARAHAFHLRNAASDAERLARLLVTAAAILEANAEVFLEEHERERETLHTASADETEKLLPA